MQTFEEPMLDNQLEHTPNHINSDMTTAGNIRN